MEKSSGSLLPTLLLVLFIGLKLAHVIAWSWLWVLSPIWVTGALVVLVFIVAVVIVAIGRAVAP
jgi:uncharacterized membrane protein YdbT with pleckstrin-like domain